MRWLRDESFNQVKSLQFPFQSVKSGTESKSESKSYSILNKFKFIFVYVPEYIEFSGTIYVVRL